ncbi:hypothetical protein AB5I41_06515 [Sphingomonas sp. MMS24-JH45]
MTKGELLHQEVKLAASGLGDLFAGVEIVSDKRPDTFTRIFHRYGVGADHAVIAAIDHADVLPALAAGAWAAHVPTDNAWSHGRRDTPSAIPRFRQIDRLGDLPRVDRGDRGVTNPRGRSPHSLRYSRKSTVLGALRPLFPSSLLPWHPRGSHAGPPTRRKHA